MKTNTVLCMALFIAAVLGSAGCATSQQGAEEDAGPRRSVVMRDQVVSDTTDVVVVTNPPPAPLNQIKPRQPSERHVWIPGRWAWQNDDYAWIKGKWVLPERGETVWIPGTWKAVKGGWVWTPGRWQDDTSDAQD